MYGMMVICLGPHYNEILCIHVLMFINYISLSDLKKTHVRKIVLPLLLIRLWSYIGFKPELLPVGWKNRKNTGGTKVQRIYGIME